MEKFRITVSILVTFCCFAASDSEAKETPGQVVVAAATAVQEKDFLTFQKYVSAEFWNSLFEMESGIREGGVTLTRKQRSEARKEFDWHVETDFSQGGGVSFFDCSSPAIQEERVVGEEAMVSVQCVRRSGEMEVEQLVVRKEGGKWKVMLPELWRESIAEIIDLRKNGEYEKALRQSMDLVTRFRKSGNIRNIVADIYLNDLHQPEKALESALNTKRELPKHPGGYYWAAKVYEKTERYGNCIDVLKELVRFSNWYGYFRDLAKCYYKNDQYSESLAALEQISTLEPEAWEHMEGWHTWVQGQIPKRKLLQAYRNDLQEKLASGDTQLRAVVLIQIGSLDVPETLPLLDQLAGDQELQRTVAILKSLVVTDPNFREERISPSGFPDQNVPAQEALKTIWDRFESIKPGVKPAPAMEGKYLMESMLEYAKQNPALATPFVVQFNEKRDAVSFGQGWVEMDGRLTPSEGYPEFVGALYSDGDMLYSVSSAFQEEGKSYTFTTYRMEEKDLIISSDHWVDHGEVFYRNQSEARYVRME